MHDCHGTATTFSHCSVDQAQWTVDKGCQDKDEDEEMEVVGVQEPVEQQLSLNYIPTLPCR